jgi:hypothetical protein
MSDCGISPILLPAAEKNIFEYKKFAKENCLRVGGIIEMNFCPNQKYLYTVNKKVLGYDVCTEIYQCVGFSWKCARSNGGNM